MVTPNTSCLTLNGYTQVSNAVGAGANLGNVAGLANNMVSGWESYRNANMLSETMNNEMFSDQKKIDEGLKMCARLKMAYLDLGEDCGCCVLELTYSYSHPGHWREDGGVGRAMVHIGHFFGWNEGHQTLHRIAPFGVKILKSVKFRYRNVECSKVPKGNTASKIPKGGDLIKTTRERQLHKM